MKTASKTVRESETDSEKAGKGQKSKRETARMTVR